MSVRIFFMVLVFLSQDLSGPSWPGTHYVDQAGLELTEIHLPLPPEYWD